MEYINVIYNTETLSISLIVMGIIMLIIGVIVYTKDRKKLSNHAFLYLTLTLGTATIIFGLFEISYGIFMTEITTNGLYIMSALMPVSLLYFNIRLSAKERRLSAITVLALVLPFLLMSIFVLIPGFITESVYDGTSGDIGKTIIFGSGYIYFVVYMITYLLASVVILIKKYIQSAGIFKKEIRDILASILITILVSVSVDIFAPMFGVFGLFWIGPLFVLLSIITIGFLIIKYNFWNMKLAATEFFVTLIILALTAEIFFAKSTVDFMVKLIIICLVVLSGVFLIRSVLNEVKAKEEVEKLLEDLSKANENLRILDKKKSEFISIASHHLRDPLTAVKGYASLLLEGSFGRLDPRVRGALDKIFESSKRLVVIIEDFMDISKIETGKMRYTFSEIDIMTLTEDLIDNMMIAVKDAGLDIAFEVDKKVPHSAYIDVGKIRQVISNLIDNGIKYTPSGNIKIFLEFRDSNKTIRLTVSDTGIGMEQETIGKIFKKFSRAKGVSKQFTDGSGLGLYVAKEMVQEHGGKIWAESDGLGKGSRFILELKASVGYVPNT